MRRPSPVILSVVLALWAVGCTPYINIPGQRGDVASHDINSSTAMEVIAVSMRHVLQRYAPSEQYGLVLPGNPTKETYQWITNSLPSGISPVIDDQGKIPTFRVKQVYVRAWSGQVDIIEPTQYGTHQLLTVYLSHDVAGWYVARSRVWRVPVEEPIRVPPPGEEPATTQKPPTAPPKPVTLITQLEAELVETKAMRESLQIRAFDAVRANNLTLKSQLDEQIAELDARILALESQIQKAKAEQNKPADNANPSTNTPQNNNAPANPNDPIFIKPEEKPQNESGESPAPQKSEAQS